MPWVAPPARLCSLCNGKVYPVEELHVDTVLYHRNCFRCQTCNKARAHVAVGAAPRRRNERAGACARPRAARPPAARAASRL